MLLRPARKPSIQHSHSVRVGLNVLLKADPMLSIRGDEPLDFAQPREDLGGSRGVGRRDVDEDIPGAVANCSTSTSDRYSASPSLPVSNGQAEMMTVATHKRDREGHDPRHNLPDDHMLVVLVCTPVQDLVVVVRSGLLGCEIVSADGVDHSLARGGVRWGGGADGC